MKLRNISFLERHVEKFALLLALLILAGTGYLYWGTEPYAVEINQQTVTPRTVDKEIKSSADRLSRMLDQDQVGEKLANLTIPEYTESFKNRVQQPLLNTSSFRVAMANRPGFDAGAGPESGEPFHVPPVPAPRLAAARADLGTIDPTEVQNSPQLANNYFASGQAPYDTTWISVLGQFDLKAMEEELARNPATGQPLPGDWWEHTFAIVEVEAERQRKRPDGTWPQPDDPDYSKFTTSVKPMPGRLSFDIPETVSSSAAGGYLRMVQQNQLSIVQPSFYATINRSWRPPNPDQEYGDKEERMKRIIDLKNSIASKENVVKQMEKRLEQLRNAGRNRSGSGPGDGTGPRGMDRGREGAGGPGGRSPGGRGAGGRGSGGSGMRGSGPGSGGPRGGSGRGMSPGSGRGGFGDQGGFGQRGSNNNNQRQDPRQRRQQQFQQRLDQAQQELDDLRLEFQRLTRIDRGDDTGFGRRSSGPRSSNPMDRDMMAEGQMMDPAMMEGMRDSRMRDPARGRMSSRRRGDSDLEQRQYTAEEIEKLARGESLEEQEQMEQEQQRQQRDRQMLGRLSLDPPTLDLWVNDMYAEPGQSYRYRIRLSVVNPLFNKEELPEEQQEEHENRFLLYSDWSDWSREISVEPMRHFFMTSASSSPPPGRANVQVWRFFSGSWESSEFRIQPGDPIGMPDELSVPDLIAEAEEWEREQDQRRRNAGRRGAEMRGGPGGMMGSEMMGPEMMGPGARGEPFGPGGQRGNRRGRQQDEEQQKPETIQIDFFTNNYLVDIDFDYPIPGQFGNRTRTTTRMLYLDENENLQTLRLDQSRRHPKIEWLQARREILGPPTVDYLAEQQGQTTDQTAQQQSRR